MFNLKIYAYSPESSHKESVVFKYSDIINRAIEYKKMHQDEEVEIYFTIYKMAKSVYVGNKPTKKDGSKSASYG